MEIITYGCKALEDVHLALLIIVKIQKQYKSSTMEDGLNELQCVIKLNVRAILLDDAV